MRYETNPSIAAGVTSGLTPRQRQICDYARRCVAVRGYGPSLRELATYLHVRSLDTVRRHVRRLERQGCVFCVGFRARAIQLVSRGGANAGALTVSPRQPSVVVAFGLGCDALGWEEAVRMARKLLAHARVSIGS